MFGLQHGNMAAYSKLVHYSCYEVGHTWTPYCSKAVIDVGIHALKESFKIYVPLYVVMALLRKKNKEYFKKKILHDIIQSTIFLGSNAFLFIGSFCFWRALTGMYCFFNVFICGIPAGALAMLVERKNRNLVGNINITTGAFVPSLCSTFIAILLERKSRRGMLAMYVMNLAMETLYRMAAFRGIITPIKHGEVLLFSMVVAIYMYLYRSRNGVRDAVRQAIQFLVGPSEAGELDPLSGASPTPTPAPRHTLVDYIVNLHPDLRAAAASWRRSTRHPLCRHPHGCVPTAIESGVRLFIIGYGTQAVVKLLGSLRQVSHHTRAPLDALLHADNAGLGKFLASFGVIFQVVNCMLRSCRGKDDRLHGLLAGFMAGISMMFYKSSSMALYMTSKLAEVLWFKGVERGVLPLIKCADILIYTVSTSILFHAAVFEPHAIRAAYWKFLLRMTNNKFGAMNRILLDGFGTQASKSLPDFWPKYDPRFTKLPSTMPIMS